MGKLRTKICKFLRNTVLIISVLLLLTYGALVIRWQTGSAQIKRNIAAEIISRTSAQAGDTPTWPVVIAALDAAGDFDFTPMDRFHPSHPQWYEWMAHASASS